MRIRTIFGTKMVHLSRTKLFGTNHCYYFHLPIGPFHCAKLKKFFTADRQLWRCTIFETKIVHLPQTVFFENYYNHSHLSIGLFHCAKFKKKFSSRSRVTRMCNLWAQNGPFPQMRIFWENLFMSFVSFIHDYLHAKNQSQILIY